MGGGAGVAGKQPGQGGVEQQAGGQAKDKGKPGIMFGPDGVPFQRAGPGDKKDRPGAGAGKPDKLADPKAAGARPADPRKPAVGVGAGGSPQPPEGAGGDAGQAPGKPADVVARLFQPESPHAPDQGGAPQGPKAGSSRRLAAAGEAPDLTDVDAIADPVEREAARRLRQAVQRIQAGRDRRPARGPQGRPVDLDGERRRDW